MHTDKNTSVRCTSRSAANFAASSYYVLRSDSTGSKLLYGCMYSFCKWLHVQRNDSATTRSSGVWAWLAIMPSVMLKLHNLWVLGGVSAESRVVGGGAYVETSGGWRYGNSGDKKEWKWKQHWIQFKATKKDTHAATFVKSSDDILPARLSNKKLCYGRGTAQRACQHRKIHAIDEWPWYTGTPTVITVAAIKLPYGISLPVCGLFFQFLYLWPFPRHYLPLLNWTWLPVTFIFDNKA